VKAMKSRRPVPKVARILRGFGSKARATWGSAQLAQTARAAAFHR
jgi:hypothetical protein